jgi:predicted alpha/beta hydrolase family esterase
MKKIIFVHGYEASAQHDWFPLVAEQLNDLGADYSIPNMPGGTYPKIKDWIEVLHEEVESSGNPIVLVGFSIGAQAVLLYLEQYHPKEIDSVVLIASYNNDWQKHRLQDNNEYNSFFEREVDLKKVKSTGAKFIVMHSKDDPWANYEWGVENARALDAQLLTYEDRGHFFKPENAVFVMEIIKQLL